MNKKIISALAVLVVVSCFNMSYAQDCEKSPCPKAKSVQMNKDMKQQKLHHGNMKKAEMAKRLNLTDEQKKQREIQRKQSRDEIKPIIDEMNAKRMELRKIQEDENLSQGEKDKQLKSVKADLKALKLKADEKRKADLNNFEALLTADQKKEFAKIKEEQKKEMDQRKKNFETVKKIEDELGLPPMKMGNPTKHPMPQKPQKELD